MPALTAPNFEVRGTSAEIDARVRQIVREALSVYRADARALRALAPDVILTQDHCEVCAASLADVDDVRRTAGEARRRRTRSSRSSSRL